MNIPIHFRFYEVFSLVLASVVTVQRMKESLCDIYKYFSEDFHQTLNTITQNLPKIKQSQKKTWVSLFKYPKATKHYNIKEAIILKNELESNKIQRMSVLIIKIRYKYTAKIKNVWAIPKFCYCWELVQSSREMQSSDGGRRLCVFLTVCLVCARTHKTLFQPYQGFKCN